ncbi:hypothetical protein DPEC_G00224650 [Dallia pectoralis]|uniref:Uncharacterized protein n=1 Tax=Dallia pectoralis TaxID=75939 RepID=A0ACC2G0A3_DALPE|nr:hypothetical protein DPEC_G00224650 [Dallia pectoralis]
MQALVDSSFLSHSFALSYLSVSFPHTPSLPSLGYESQHLVTVERRSCSIDKRSRGVQSRSDGSLRASFSPPDHRVWLWELREAGWKVVGGGALQLSLLLRQLLSDDAAPASKSSPQTLRSVTQR